MMSISDLFPDFSEDTSAKLEPAAFSDTALDDLRLNSYEQGYSAGWEDSQKASEKLGIRATETLLRSLEDMSFTYHEVRTQMIRDMNPFLEALFQTVVPSLAQTGMAENIRQDLERAFEQGLASGATLYVAPGAVGLFETLMSETLPMPVNLEEDPCLRSSQVSLKIGQSEAVLDLDAVLKGIEREVDAHFSYDKKEVKVG